MMCICLYLIFMNMFYMINDKISYKYIMNDRCDNNLLYIPNKNQLLYNTLHILDYIRINKLSLN